MKPISLILVLLLGGCATTNPYASFAEAGGTYATRLAGVLAAAERTGVDATSWRLLDNDVLSNTTPEMYAEYNERDRARAETLRRLRHHGDVLARYFGALSLLANTDAPTRASKQIGQAHGAIGTAWEDLSAMGQDLRANVSFPPAAAVSEVSKVIVGQVVRGVLRKELELRGDAIALELATQEAVLETIAATIEHDLAIGAAVAERLLVMDPLLAEEPLLEPQEWVETRQRIVTAEKSLEEVRAARAAAGALRETFEALTSGADAKAKKGEADAD
ncbi:MAG: hypothetical protein KDA24_10765 [Deltaproteobacteria bacterium]|nr:hypothetical protein [Deltaproteobacteria bacterium]